MNQIIWIVSNKGVNMNYTLEESLDKAESLINAIKIQQRGENDEDILLKLEAVLMCFQHHINTLTRSSK